MRRNLIDTNLIIRFLVNDNPEKVLRVEKLLRDRENRNILLDTVVAEIIWVLSSYYELEKSDVVKKVRALISLDTIECNDFLINKALTLWEKNNISYIDSYLVAVSQIGNITIYSYDQRLKSISGTKTKEP